VLALHVNGGLLYGGIERMLANFAGIESGRVRQAFAVPAENRLYSELRDADVDVVPLPRARASRPLSVFAARRRFEMLLEALNPDAVVLHGSWAHAMFAGVARRRAVIAFWQHAPMLKPTWLDQWASRTRPDVTIANSRFTASMPLFPSLTAHVIYCPVPPAPTPTSLDRLAGRSEFGARDCDVVVLMASRFEAWKGHAVLIEAGGRLREAANVRIWIAGGVQHTSERTYFEQLQRDAATARTPVVFLGQRTDVRRLMTLADVYCQPNTAPEPFGLSIAEAMSAGLPCVVSRSGGATELVEDRCGVLATPGDAGEIASALQRLATDPARRGAMGAAARNRVGMLTNPAARLDELASALTLAAGVARRASRATVA
jgi:glycosyltransferase involved in cell wall biosynthesis